jgi:predicted nucleic acid-binding protein
VPLVDTNVLLDLFTNDPIWADWSARQLRILSAQEALIVSPVIYAELSVGYDRVEDLDAALATAGVELVEIPRAPRCSWPAGRSRHIEPNAAPGPACCPISSLARTPSLQGSAS